MRAKLLFWGLVAIEILLIIFLWTYRKCPNFTDCVGSASDTIIACPLMACTTYRHYSLIIFGILLLTLIAGKVLPGKQR